MKWESLLAVVIQLGIFAMFITSMLEVIKGISAVGLKNIFKELWRTLIHNSPMESQSFPVLNFAIALLCCWAFNLTIISYLFNNIFGLQLSESTYRQKWFAQKIDYFGTASLTYLGAQQLFDRFIKMKQQADQLLDKTTTKTSESSASKTVETKTVTEAGDEKNK